MANRRPESRLVSIPDTQLTALQRALRDKIMSSRGASTVGGPFAVWLHAPNFGDLVQQFGAHCRYQTSLPPWLSEFAILVVARFWRAQYEWYAHAPIAEKAGVKPESIKDLRAGRRPKKARKDEQAIYDFITELHRTHRVSNKTYSRVHHLLGDAGMVEFVGIIGYYTLVSMTLNTFRVPIPDAQPLPFREPVAKR